MIGGAKLIGLAGVIAALLGVGEMARGDGLYTPNSTTLDAATGGSSLNGPDDHQNLGTQIGSHAANSNYSYFSGWSQSTVACAASAGASLSDGLISLTASNSTNGYDYNDTQGIASAVVNFTLPGSEWITLSDSASDAVNDQVSCTLVGPDGWTWNGPYGSAVLAPAGGYCFSVSADIERTVGVDSDSSEKASLQIVPEPGAMGVVIGAVWALSRKRKASL